MIKNADQYTLSDGARLGIVLLDLVVAMLAHELDIETSIPSETHRRVLLLASLRSKA